MKCNWSALLTLMMVGGVSQAGVLPVPLIPQQTNMWCWAASGQMVMNYLGATGVAQCKEANRELGRTDCCNSPVPSACVQGGHVQWDEYNFNHSHTSLLSWAEIKYEIDHNRPISYAWNWDGGGGHVMVLIGYKTIDGVNYVTINNPWQPNIGAQYDLTYSAWISGSGYTHQGDDYNIVDDRQCYADFHDLSAGSFQNCFDYQTLRGRWPVTLTTYDDFWGTYMAGSFRSGSSRPVRTQMTASQFQSYFNTYAGQGWRPDSVSVLSTSSGPLFTAIWAPVDGPFETLFGMTGASFATKWSEMYNAGYLNTDLYAYDDNGIKYVATWVKKANNGYATYINMTSSDYNTKFSQFANQGLRPTRFSAVETSSGTRYSAIWQRLPESFVMYYGMDSSSYQSTYNNLSGQGFRLANISGLDDILAAVWIK